MSDYLLGVDVSKWQGDMDWEKCFNAGARFAFIRAGSIDNTSGNCYMDYQYMRNVSLAPDYMPIGCYWYFRPNHDPIRQADYFSDLIDEEAWLIPPVLDLETTGGLNPGGVTGAAVAFIAQVYNNLNIWPIVYSRSYFLHDQTTNNPLYAECDLWIARYTTKPEPWGNPGDAVKFKPPYWDDWTFWQYIADSNAAVQYGGEGPPGGDDDIDLNYFHGDQAAFDEYINKPPAPTPLPNDIGVKVDIDGVKYWGRISRVDE